MKEQTNSALPPSGLDLFGNAPPPPQVKQVVEEEKKQAGLRVRILEYFKDRKYQSFTTKEVVEAFSTSKLIAVERAVAQLRKSRHIIGTGANRGSGVDNQCLTLNLHRR